MIHVIFHLGLGLFIGIAIACGIVFYARKYTLVAQPTNTVVKIRHVPDRIQSIDLGEYYVSLIGRRLLKFVINGSTYRPSFNVCRIEKNYSDDDTKITYVLVEFVTKDGTLMVCETFGKLDGERDFKAFFDHLARLGDIPLPNNDERIICAANWYKDLPTGNHNPVNIANGIVICGLRHNNPIDVLKTIAELRSVTYGIDAAGPHEQGFLTSHNRFVSRAEAFEIAKKQKQLNSRARGSSTDLYSEDLY